MTSNSLNMAMMDQPATAEKERPSGQWLYKLGGAAAGSGSSWSRITQITQIFNR